MSCLSLLASALSTQAALAQFSAPIAAAVTQQFVARTNDVVSKLPAMDKQALTSQLATSQKALQRQLEGIDARLRSEAIETVSEDERARLREMRATVQKGLVVVDVAQRVTSGAALNSADVPYYDQALESLISLVNPTLPLCGNALSYRGTPVQVSWQASLNQFLSRFGDKLPAIGRIEVDVERFIAGADQPRRIVTRILVGTGFAISAREVVTAGHVAAQIWNIPTKQLRSSIIAVYFNNGGEYDFQCPTANKSARVTELGKLDDAQYDATAGPETSPIDYAVIEIAPNADPLPSTLSIARLAPTISTEVVAIGYPDKDSLTDSHSWTAAMTVPVDGGQFPVAGIKRISPSRIVPPCTNATLLHISHEATTFNHSSGSPIIDMDSGTVVGIHVKGTGIDPGFPGYCNLALKALSAPPLNALMLQMTAGSNSWTRQ